MADLRRNALFQAYDEEYAADRARTIASMGPQPIDPSRPILSNSDGTFSTEKTFSIDFDGKYILLPQIVNGRDVGQEEAARMFFRKEIRPIAVHDSLEESNSYAQQRSSEIGELRGRGGDLDRVKEWFKDPEFVKLPLQTKKETLGRFFDAESPPEFKQLPPDKFAWSRNKFIETQIGENRPEPPSRGVVSDIGVSAARGVLGTGGLISRGAAGADELLKHYGVADLGIAKRAREFDKAVNEYKEETFPTSKEAREPGWRKTWTGGLESAVTSLGAAAPLAAIGAVAGAAGPVGAFGGAAIGYIMGAPMFGLSQYDTALEKYKKAGLPKDEAHMGALFEGMHETGWELVSNALDIVTLKFGGLVSKPVKNAAAGAVQRTIRSSFLEAGKRGLAIAGVEGSSELATSGFQAETEHAYGEEYGMKTQRFWDAVTEQFGQIAVSSLIFGALGAGGHKALTRSTTRSLEDENAPIENRVAAVKTVYGELRRKDPSLAKAWIESATAAIENKKPITTNIGDESIYEKPKGREESFFERITSDVAEGRVTAEELQQVRQGMPDTDPRAQAIDRFFARQAARPQSRYLSPYEDFRQAELTPRPTRTTTAERQKQIWRETGYEAPPEAPVVPKSEQNQKTIDRLWSQYQAEIENGTIQGQDDLLNEMVLDSRQMARPLGIETLRSTAAKMWQDLKAGAPRRTAESRQRFIDSETGITQAERTARTRQGEINTLWEKYEQGAADGAYESKKDLIDEMRADARAAGQQIPNPEIKRLADRVWAMAKRSERNPEIERTRQRVEDIPRRTEEAKRALSWEEVLRTTPVNIESASPYAGMPAGAREAATTEKTAQAAPEQVAPAVAPPSKPTIEFKTNEEAVEFGTKATPEQVAEMRRLYEESKAKSSELIKGDDLDAAMREGTRGQFYRESIEASEGRHPTQIAAKKAADKSQPIETQPAAVKVDGVKAEEAPRESRRDRSMREYKAYVGSLPEASREAVKLLIEDNPQSPSVQTRKIQKAVAEFEKKPVPKPGPVEVDRKAKAEKPKPSEPEVKIIEKHEEVNVKTDLTKKQEAALAPKDQKKYLLAEIDKTIKGVPDKPIEGKTVTFEVPGDGEFTVAFDKEVLKNFREIVEKRWPENAKRVKQVHSQAGQINWSGIEKKFSDKVKNPSELTVEEYRKIRNGLGEVSKRDNLLYGSGIEQYAVNQAAFDNWLLGQNITREVKDAIRETATSGEKPTTPETKPETTELKGEKVGAKEAAGAKIVKERLEKEKPEPKPKADKKSGALEDFGSKLGGARKDQQGSISREISDDEISTIQTKETEQGVAMFAKGRPRKTRPSGMEKGALDPVIERIASFWKNGPAVKVVQHQHELPEGIITWLKKAGAYDDIVRGVFHKGRVYLVADNFDNSSDAVRTMMHESFGHFGIRRMLGDQWASIMYQAYRSHGDAIRQVAKEYGYDISTEKGRNLGAEEWLAREAETNPKSTIVERVVAAIRRMLRRLGLELEMTDGEVRDLLVRAREYVQTGRPANMLKVFKGAMFEKQGREQLWYSQMERVLGQKLPGKGNPRAIASMLEGWARKGEFKAEELEWSGISDWLNEHKAAIVTKSEVMEWLAENNVRVQEVVKSEQKGRKTEDQANEDLTEYVDLLYEKYPDASTIDELEKQISVYEKRRLNELNNALNDAMRDTSGGGDLAVYSQYQTPGGSNYREILLTLPENKVKPMSFDEWLKKYHNTTIDELEEKGYVNGGMLRTQYNLSQNATAHRSADTANFRSTHYQEPNILAHVRFNERTDEDGRKVLFIDEIQSDWAQKGRKEGFKKTVWENFDKQLAIEEHPLNGGFVEKNGRLVWEDKKAERFDVTHGDKIIGIFKTKQEAEKALQKFESAGGRNVTSGITPDAPFVKDTGKWSMLAMRRMVRWAAENGFDRVAWTTGEMQAARYDLSKHVETIGYQKRGDNFNITVWGKNGEKIWQNQSATAKEVEDTIGKEMLEKMNNEQGRSESGLHYLEGLDLKVGGEGMKGFYDKILPSEVNKFFNKQSWGNAKVGTTKIDTTERLSDGYSGVGEDKKGSRNGAFVSVHSLDINDVMREKAMGGMPLFSKSKQQAKTYLDRLNEAPEFKGMKADLTVPPDTRGMLRDVRKWARNRFGKGYVDRDMKRLNKVLETPYGLSKKFPSMAKAMKTELDASEDRSEILFNDYDKTGLSELQDHLRKNKAHQREITGLIWKWDGNRFPRRAVPTEAINFPADITYDLTINEGHYTEMREFLGKQGVTPEVADGFVLLRRLLDKKLVEIDKVMRVEDLDAELITQYRGEIGKINNYFPHRRSGNSNVTVINREKRGTDDAVVYREHYFSQLDRLQPVEGKARARAEKWLREAVANGKLQGQVSDYDISQGAVKQLPDEVFFQIPVEGMQQLADVAGRELEKSRVQYEAERLLKNGEVGSMAEGIELAHKRLRKDMGAALSKAIAEVFKSRGWARSAIPRKGIPGHETEDVFGILFDYLSGFAGFKTKIQRAREHSATLHSINAKSRPEEYRYVSNYVKDMLANQDATDRAVDTVRGLFFLKYLGFVLKSGVVNLTQNAVMAAPRLSIETSHANAKLSKAMFDVRKALYSKAAILGKEVQYEGLNASERRMLHEMTEQGISIDQFLRELKGHIPGKNIYSQAIRNFVDKSGIFMQLAERFNRASTALAAYRVGVNEKGMDHEKAVEFAKGIVYDSHFVYGKHNLPMWARGGQARKYLRSAYTFRAFTHNYLNMIHYMATKQGIRGKLAVARSLRNTILVGGLASFPFFKALGSAVMWALGDDDKDAMTALREQLPNTWTRDLLTYGLPGAAGVDISGSLSLDMPREWYEILGVPYAAYKDTLNMVESWKSGQTMRAVAESPITPMMVRNAMRGLELYTTGQHTRSGRPLNAPGEVGPRKIDEIDLMKKAALGFQPIEISKGYAQSQALNKAMDKADEKKKYLSDRYVNAMIRDNQSEMSKVLAEVLEWNEKMYKDGKPHLAIDLRGSIKARLAQPIQKIPKAMRGNALRTAEAWQ